MSLTQLLIEASKKDIILNKIGIPEEVYTIIKNNIPEKYQIWVADNILLTAISATTNTRIDSKSEAQSAKSKYRNSNDFVRGMIEKTIKSYASIRKDFIENQYKHFIERIVQNNTAPKLNFKEVFTFDHVSNKLNEWGSIRDWYVTATPRPNISSMEWDQAYEQSVQWHEELEASGKQLNIKEGQTIIHTFEDGYYWLDLGTNKCEDEGGAMGHCGNTDADTLLSLRDAHGEPHVTVAYNYNGTYQQMKGKGNKKPHKKYHPYIVELFIDVKSPKPESGSYNEVYKFIDYDPEYKRKDDFHLTDLNKELFDKVIQNMNIDTLKNFIRHLSIADLVHKMNYKVVRVDIDKEMEQRIKEIDNGMHKWWVVIKKLAKRSKLLEFLFRFNLLDKKKYDLLSNSEFLFVVEYPFWMSNMEKLVAPLKNKEEIIILNISRSNHDHLDIFYK